MIPWLSVARKIIPHLCPFTFLALSRSERSRLSCVSSEDNVHVVDASFQVFFSLLVRNRSSTFSLFLCFVFGRHFMCRGVCLLFGSHFKSFSPCRLSKKTESTTGSTVQCQRSDRGRWKERENWQRLSGFKKCVCARARVCL